MTHGCAGECPDIGAFFTVNIIGKSMFPVFSSGSTAKARLCSFNDLCAGDIAVFKNVDGGFTCHRVFKKVLKDGRRFLKTKGDATLRFDSPVPVDLFAGKIVSVKRCGIDIPVENMLCRVAGLAFGYALPLLARPFIYAKRVLSRVARNQR
ncbi:MAG: hypothetical protein JW919_07415 [Candidatus Omnitrophica bacterium]|nr:hypothetical protein [Candidatus Omnitrophota bacterium]